MNETAPRLGYRPALDGFRAVAIVLVLLHHTGAFLWPSAADWLLPSGFLGVDLFFVLSGFLITTLLLERRGRERRPILTFYARRILRLFPALLVLLAVMLVYSLLADQDVGVLGQTSLVVVTYTMNWAEVAGVHLSHYLTHLWSLAVEEQFYLVWPLVLYGGLRLVGTRERMVWVALGLAFIVGVWRAVEWHDHIAALYLYQRTDTRADGLLIGAALALAPWRRIADHVRGRTASVVGGLCLAAIFAAGLTLSFTDRLYYVGGFTLIAVLATVTLASLLQDGPLPRVLAVTPLVWVGRLSYSLYLWHFPVFRVTAEHTTAWATAPRIALGWVLAFAAAAASYHLVERPALKLKGRLHDGTLTPRGRARRADPLPAAATAPTSHEIRRGENDPEP